MIHKLYMHHLSNLNAFKKGNIFALKFTSFFIWLVLDSKVMKCKITLEHMFETSIPPINECFEMQTRVFLLINMIYFLIHILFYMKPIRIT